MQIPAHRFFGGIGIAFLVLLALTLGESFMPEPRMGQEASIIDATTSETSPGETQAVMSTPITPSTTPAIKSDDTDIPVVTQTAPTTEGPSVSPSAPSIGYGVSLGEREALIDLHNEARMAVGVPSVTWSRDLAVFAEARAEELGQRGCVVEHSGDGQYGENLYHARMSSGQATVADVVGAFVAEAKDYDAYTNTCTADASCGHYTQVVWEDTTKIGCGRAICMQGDVRSEVWVCAYAPRGNVRGERPFAN